MTVKRNGGFTLFEVLVTLSLVVLILGTAYGTYAGTLKSVSRCRSAAGLNEDARAVLREMARELRCACIPVSGCGKDGAASFVFDGGNRYPLMFATTAAACGFDSASAGIGTVAYKLDAARGVLLRGQAGLAGGEHLHWQAVARGVQAMDVQFLDGQVWHRTWDFTDRRSLPAAVQVAITLRNTDGDQATFTAATWIPSERSLDAVRRLATPDPPQTPDSEAGSDDATLAKE